MDETEVSPEIILDARRRVNRRGTISTGIVTGMCATLLIIRLFEGKPVDLRWPLALMGIVAAISVTYYAVGWWRAKRDLRAFRALHDERLRAEFGR